MTQVPIISSSGLVLTADERVHLNLFKTQVNRLRWSVLLGNFILNNPLCPENHKNIAIAAVAAHLEAYDLAEVTFIINIRAANANQHEVESALDRGDEVSEHAAELLDTFEPTEVIHNLDQLPFNIN